MQDTEFKKANKDELRSLFGYLEFCLTQIVKDNELGALEQVCSNLKACLFWPAVLSYAVLTHIKQGTPQTRSFVTQDKVHWYVAGLLHSRRGVCIDHF